MNIDIIAEKEIMTDGDNLVIDVQSDRFNAIQTPTLVTYEIVRSENPVEAYIEYVKSRSNVEKIPVYAPDDIFGEKEPVGFKDYDWSIGHVEGFKAWIAEMKLQGYTIKFEVI